MTNISKIFILSSTFLFQFTSNTTTLPIHPTTAQLAKMDLLSLSHPDVFGYCLSNAGTQNNTPNKVLPTYFPIHILSKNYMEKSTNTQKQKSFQVAQTSFHKLHPIFIIFKYHLFSNIHYYFRILRSRIRRFNDKLIHCDHEL